MLPSVHSTVSVPKGHSLPPLSVMMGQQRPVSPVSTTPSPTASAAELHKILPKTDKCTCKADGNHIPRPRNAFILFRQKNHQALLEEGSVIKTNPDVSRELGKRWRNLSPEEKAYWNKKAEEEKKKHAEKYPGYKYTPRRAMKKSCVACRARNAIKNHNLSVQYYQQQQQQQHQQQQHQQQQQQQHQQQQQQYWEYQMRASSSSPQGYLPSPQQSSTGSVSSVSSTSSNYAPMKNYTTSLPFPTYSIPNGQALQPPLFAGQLPPPQVVLPRQHQPQPLMHHHHNPQAMALPPISNLSLPPLHMNLVPRNINETR